MDYSEFNEEAFDLQRLLESALDVDSEISQQKLGGNDDAATVTAMRHGGGHRQLHGENKCSAKSAEKVRPLVLY